MAEQSEMKAGRELDEAIAREVFNIDVRHANAEQRLLAVRHYSTDIAAAWEVVEKLTSTTKQWFRFEQHSTGSTAVFAVSGAGNADFEAEVEAEDGPLAICLAALNAVRQQNIKHHS